MNYNIIVNKRIYECYKDDFITLNARMFTNEYFYDIDSYKNDLALKGISNYLAFTKEIVIYATSSFIDFVNILLILSYLKESNYDNTIIVKYYLLNQASITDAKIAEIKLASKDYLNVNLLINQIKSFKKATVYDVKLIGINNFLNFYNMLVDYDKFLLSLDEVIEEKDLNKKEIASYLYEKYSNMGLSMEFYQNYLKKVCDENV
ncbi:MAG: hypothetical protein SOU19_09620 [Candidatus Caccosoma sp.]|nr:hypothetical protein [Candidatus Caccosoma sp.]